MNLTLAGIKTVCYNFMPVFDWSSSDLWREREDIRTSLQSRNH